MTILIAFCRDSGTAVHRPPPSTLTRMDTLLPGISAERVPTSRLTVNVLAVAGREDGDGPAVLFVHGNVSSSLFWQPTMLALPEPYRPMAVDLRGFGDTDDEPIDATRGVRDFSDDLAAAIEALTRTRSTWSAGAWAAGWRCSTWWTGRARTGSRR